MEVHNRLRAIQLLPMNGSDVVTNLELGERSEVLFLSPPLYFLFSPILCPTLFSPLLFFLPSPPLSSSLALTSRLSSLPFLRSRPIKSSQGSGSAVSSPSGLWGRAPAEIEFSAFHF